MEFESYNYDNNEWEPVTEERLIEIATGNWAPVDEYIMSLKKNLRAGHHQKITPFTLVRMKVDRIPVGGGGSIIDDDGAE